MVLVVIHMNNVIVTLLLLSLIGCDSWQEARTPQQKNLVPQSLEDISFPVSDEDEDFVFDPGLEENEPIISEKFYKPVSLSVTENMSIRNILVQLANTAGLNIFFNGDIEGSVVFHAKARPLIEVLKDICSSVGLKYTINGDSVKIEYDSPMLKVYNVQFLNIERDIHSSISISTDIFSNNNLDETTSNTQNNNNGSCSLVTGVSKSDFWEELERSLKLIIGDDEKSYVSIHRQGGIVTVYATQNKQELVKNYLKLLKDSSEAQVLIEAKILEVNLNDEFKGGINWDILRNNGALISKNFDNNMGRRSELLSFGISRANLNIVAGLIEKFGAVKTLSSPRITVLNNQSAVLKVAQNEVIYLPSLQRQYATVSDNRSTDFLSTTLHTIPVGLIMSVIPSVDIRNNTILLNLRPTISRIVKYKELPLLYRTNVAGNDNNENTSYQTQKIPIVDVREFDSVLRLQSGQVVVMGGLMQETSHNNRNGLPGLSETDVLFGAREKGTDVTELVIFLKATILRKKSYHNADKKLYKKFANDPRPLEFKK